MQVEAVRDVKISFKIRDIAKVDTVNQTFYADFIVIGDLNCCLCACPCPCT